MEYRPLNITIISAKDIKDVKLFSKMDVYAQVSIAGYPQSMKKTFVDKDSGSSPKWNHAMDFIVDEPYLTKPGLNLLFELKAQSTFSKDKEIGSVTIPIHQLFIPDSPNNEDKTVDYQVITPSGKPKGSLRFSYRFGDKFTQEAKKHIDEPVTAYPAQPPQSSYMAPPPPYGPPAGYPPQYGGPPAGYPPQMSGYGYHQPPPQQGYGYGYPPPGVYGQAQKPKKNKMGMGGGLGMGLGAGLLGGLLVGEMVGDASAYADGYGDAMGDMGGGDFDF